MGPEVWAEVHKVGVCVHAHENAGSDAYGSLELLGTEACDPPLTDTDVRKEGVDSRLPFPRPAEGRSARKRKTERVKQ